MTLVVGATGLLGSEICRHMREIGMPVRALVRIGSDPAKIENLKGLGAEIVEGDLKNPSSLDAACQGVTTVISTASATLSRREGDSLESVDRDGQIHLIDAAKAANGEHFVLISFPHDQFVQCPLNDAKVAAEQHLKQSGLAYTVLQASYFMEVWLSPALGFDPAAGTARIYGDGKNKLNWISYRDVARFAVRSITEPQARNRVLELGGPEALSPLDVVAAFEAAGSKPITVEHVPESALQAQLEQAEDPLEKTFAALMLTYASGNLIEMSETLKVLPMELTPMKDYIAQTLAGITSKGKGANA